jgi:hypothetical protein
MRIKNIPVILVFMVAVLGAGCSGGAASNSNSTPTNTNPFANPGPTFTPAPPVPTSTVPQVAAIETVHVVRTSDSAHSTLPPFNYTGQDTTTVQALYNDLLALPKYVPGQITCATDIGVQYNLTFTHGGTVVLSAIADPSGCQIVVVNGHDNRTATHSKLWTLLANAVGVSPTQVYPVTSS